jgi:hypothetical protein
MGAPANPKLARRRQLHQESAAEPSQQGSDGSHLTYATFVSSSADNSFLSRSQTTQQSTTKARHLSSSAGNTTGADIEHITPKRYLTQSNQLVGGVFLHLTRKKSVTSCSPHFSQKLSHACQYSKLTGNAIRGTYTSIG